MTAAGDGPVRVERDGDLALLVIDHPPLNLFDDAVFDGLDTSLSDLVRATAPGAAGRARAVLVEARGKVVSAGVQVQRFREIADGPDPVGEGTALWSRLLGLTQTLERLPVPTVFAAHGLTLTAAFELALACDLLLAAESASFGLVEVVVGLTPSMGGPQRLTERAGPARARELIYSGDRYDARRLEHWGVVNRVLPDSGFAGAARSFAHRLAAGPTGAHAATKQIIDSAARAGVSAADAMTPGIGGPLFATDDLRTAVTSFLTDGPGRAAYRGR